MYSATLSATFIYYQVLGLKVFSPGLYHVHVYLCRIKGKLSPCNVVSVQQLCCHDVSTCTCSLSLFKGFLTLKYMYKVSCILLCIQFKKEKVFLADLVSIQQHCCNMTVHVHVHVVYNFFKLVFCLIRTSYHAYLCIAEGKLSP